MILQVLILYCCCCTAAVKTGKKAGVRMFRTTAHIIWSTRGYIRIYVNIPYYMV